jgi:hypothetical protein
MSLLPKDKYILPRKLVARLNVIKVSAGIPEPLHARAQRIVSQTEEVNSARAKRVRWDAILRIRILRSGRLETKRDSMGSCKELL